MLSNDNAWVFHIMRGEYNFLPVNLALRGVAAFIAYGRFLVRIIAPASLSTVRVNYIATQGGTNGIHRGATVNPAQPLNNYVAISDQYLLEAGLLFPVSHEHRIGATLGPRWEGVPAKNLFPVSNDGFRRPGFAVTLGPGIEYAHGANLLQAGVYKAVHRDRTSSYPDSVYGTHGDAAFAQYVWLASWTHRF